MVCKTPYTMYIVCVMYKSERVCVCRSVWVIYNTRQALEDAREWVAKGVAFVYKHAYVFECAVYVFALSEQCQSDGVDVEVCSDCRHGESAACKAAGYPQCRQVG